MKTLDDLTNLKRMLGKKMLGNGDSEIIENLFPAMSGNNVHQGRRSDGITMAYTYMYLFSRLK